MDTPQDSEIGRGGIDAAASVDPDDVRSWIVRADMYRFLSGCFHYPETDVATTNLSVLALGLERITSIPDVIRSQIHRVADALNRVEGGDLRFEYERLFGTNPLCSPYETSYCPVRKERILGDLAGFYRAFGLMPVAARPDMPDHICAEMEFMSVVLLKAAYGLRRGAREMAEVCLHAHQVFLADHVGRWYDTFAEAAAERTDLDVFRGEADLLRAWVETDLRLSRVSTMPYGADPLLDSLRRPRSEAERDGAESSLPLGDPQTDCPLVS